MRAVDGNDQEAASHNARRRCQGVCSLDCTAQFLRDVNARILYNLDKVESLQLSNLQYQRFIVEEW
jgi:hypothetical protein